MSAAFDASRSARILRDEAHFSAEQAEGMAEVLQSGLATKVDVRIAIDALKGDTRAVVDEPKGDIDR